MLFSSLHLHSNPPPPWASGHAGQPSLLPFYTLPSSLLWSLVPLLHSSLFPIFPLPCGPVLFSSWKCARRWGVKVRISDRGVGPPDRGSPGSLARALLNPPDRPGASQEPPRATQDPPTDAQDPLRAAQDLQERHKSIPRATQELPRTTPGRPGSQKQLLFVTFFMFFEN